jgi:hypothetical protein
MNDMKQLSPYICAGIALVLTVALSPNLFAQSAAETLQQKVGLPADSPIPTPGTSTPEDLGTIGVVQKYPKPDMFTFSTTQQYFYSNNVYYTQAHPASSSAYLGSYTASFVPYSLVDWTPRITAQYNMARYGNEPNADFNNKNIAFSSQYVFTKDRQWSWTAAIDLSNFTSPHGTPVAIGSSIFYKEIVYDNQITHVTQLSKDNDLYLVSTWDLAFHQSNPSMYSRVDNSLNFSLTYYPCKQVSVGPYVRPEARFYTNDTPIQNNRRDFNLEEGIDVTYQPCKYVALSADLTNCNDWCNTVNQSYNVFSPGVSVTGTYKF